MECGDSSLECLRKTVFAEFQNRTVSTIRNGDIQSRLADAKGFDWTCDGKSKEGQILRHDWSHIRWDWRLVQVRRLGVDLWNQMHEASGMLRK